jgi:hypothetical protein
MDARRAPLWVASILSPAERTFARHAPAAPALGTSRRTRLARTAATVWSALEDFGYARARRDLAQIADRYEQTNPELARQLRRLDR